MTIFLAIVPLSDSETIQCNNAALTSRMCSYYKWSTQIICHAHCPALSGVLFILLSNCPQAIGYPTHLQIRKESFNVQTPVCRIPVAIVPDVLEASIRKDRFMVFCGKRRFNLRLPYVVYIKRVVFLNPSNEQRLCWKSWELKSKHLDTSLWRNQNVFIFFLLHPRSKILAALCTYPTKDQKYR